MKKYICVMLLISVLLSCCACGAKKDTTPAPVATLDPLSNEAKFGHIDQTQPQDGVYKIWNAEGVKYMLTLRDAQIEILCDIDMGGALLEPMAEFSGSLTGGNFTISNFTVEGTGENVGLIGINKGSISNLQLQNVVVKSGTKAKYIGFVAGINEGTISRCAPSGQLLVEAAAYAAAMAWAYRALGGVSGDVAGFALTVSECAALVALSAV